MAAAGRIGPLAGVPTLIKDVASQAGLPFTFGSRAYRSRIGMKWMMFTEEEVIGKKREAKGLYNPTSAKVS